MSIVNFNPTSWNEGAAPGISAAELNRIETAVEAIAAGTWNAGGGTVQFTLGGNATITHTSGNIFRIGFVSEAATSRLQITPDGSFQISDHLGNLRFVTFADGRYRLYDTNGIRYRWEEATGHQFSPKVGEPYVLAVDTLGGGIAQARVINTHQRAVGEAGGLRNFWCDTRAPLGGDGADGDVWIGITGGGSSHGIWIKISGSWNKIAAL